MNLLRRGNQPSRKPSLPKVGRPDLCYLVFSFGETAATRDDDTRPETVLSVPWQKMASTRRREILIPEGTSLQRVRRIRSENRATLVASIARSRRWLNELISDPAASTESIAEREQSSIRNVNRTLSLAFLAPDLVRAAIEGRLPHGMGVTRFADLPAEWSRQRRILGLASS